MHIQYNEDVSKEEEKITSADKNISIFAIKRNIDDTGINESAKSYAW